MTKLLVLLLLTVAALGAIALPAPRTESASPGETVAPLLSCPNVDASADNKVTVGDILGVVGAYFKDYPTASYVFMYDLSVPLNPEAGPPQVGGLQRVDDILYVVNRYFQICPLVDTQVAKATRWALDMDGNPANGMQPVPQLESEAALEAIGYYQATSDVPGQGVHYINQQNWDGVFDPAAPEGLVYHDGRLAAQLYVVDGNVVGWGMHEATSFPPPAAPYGVDLEGDPDGPQCDPACSWDGSYDGWHMHYFLCTIDVGTPSAIRILPPSFPQVQTESGCASFGGGDPQCTIPITVTSCYRWGMNVGWMGYLWNWLPNANRVPDVNGTMNGRFADCFPDGEGWKAHDCSPSLLAGIPIVASNPGFSSGSWNGYVNYDTDRLRFGIVDVHNGLLGTSHCSAATALNGSFATAAGRIQANLQVRHAFWFLTSLHHGQTVCDPPWTGSAYGWGARQAEMFIQAVQLSGYSGWIDLLFGDVEYVTPLPPTCETDLARWPCDDASTNREVIKGFSEYIGYIAPYRNGVYSSVGQWNSITNQATASDISTPNFWLADYTIAQWEQLAYKVGVLQGWGYTVASWQYTADEGPGCVMTYSTAESFANAAFAQGSTSSGLTVGTTTR